MVTHQNCYIMSSFFFVFLIMFLKIKRKEKKKKNQMVCLLHSLRTLSSTSRYGGWQNRGWPIEQLHRMGRDPLCYKRPSEL